MSNLRAKELINIKMGLVLFNCPISVKKTYREGKNSQKMLKFMSKVLDFVENCGMFHHNGPSSTYTNVEVSSRKKR